MEMGDTGMRKVIVELTCDLPHPKEVAATETIRFTLNGSAFELDACADDAKKMRAAMAPFTGAARPEVKAKPRPQARAWPQKKHAQVVREWASAHNMPVGARGRIPARVEAAYAADQADKHAERAVMTVIQGNIDPAPAVVLREPDIGAAANRAAARLASAGKPPAGKPAGESTPKGAAV
jgi:nucleoid-associated protein Lsr2